MSFIPTNNKKIGSIIILTQELSNVRGVFTPGTEMRITGIGDRGYNLADAFGNEIYEVGWNLDSFSKPT